MDEATELDACALFAPCGAELKRFALSSPLCRTENFKPRETIYCADCFERSLGVIVSGRCRVTKPVQDGREVVMSALKAGDIFGAAALFTDEREYVTRIRAAAACRVIFLKEQLVRALFEKDRALCERYIAYLCGRIRFLNKRIEAFTGGSAEQRLLSYALNAAREENGRRITPPLSASALACALDVGRASLYRAMDALSAQGKIAREGKRIILLDK